MARKRATASKTRWLIVSSTNLLLPLQRPRYPGQEKMLVAADGDSPADEDAPDEGAKGDLLQPEYGGPCEPGRHVEQHGDGEHGEQQPTEPHENALDDVQRPPFQVALLLQNNRILWTARRSRSPLWNLRRRRGGAREVNPARARAPGSAPQSSPRSSAILSWSGSAISLKLSLSTSSTNCTPSAL